MAALVAVAAPVGAQPPVPVPAPTTADGNDGATVNTTPAPAPTPAPLLDLAAIKVLIEARRGALAEAEARHAERVAAIVAEATKTAAAAEQVSRARVDESTEAVRAAEAVVEQRRSALDAARGEHRAAQQRQTDALGRIRSVAVGGFARTTDPLDPVAAAVFGDRDLADATSTAVYATAAARGATDAAQRAAKAERDAERAIGRASAAVDDARESLTTAQGELDRSQSALDATLVANKDMVTAAADVPLPPELLVTGIGTGDAIGPAGPPVMGTSLVPAEDLAVFVRAKGRPHPSVDIDELAELFIAEGALEGVAADIAWVQSIIETGWFGYRASMVLPSDNNYAGIGACDSCLRGFVFGTPRLGARAQMQLLRIYATPGLRSADLANPPVRTVPERLHVRGCCGTWMELSGVWATGPGYGIKILSLYNELLAFSATRRGA